MASNMSAFFRADTKFGLVVSPSFAYLLALPMVVAITVFLIGPLSALFFEIFSGGIDSAIKTYKNIFSSELFITTFFRTFRIATIVTIITIILSFIFAYALWRSPSWLRTFGLLIILFPMFTSIIVRTYAWISVFSRNGVLNSVLEWLSVVERPLRLLGSEPVVLVGMVQVMMPFAVLPILAGLLKIDGDLIAAARILGANQLQLLRDLILPMVKRSIVAAAVLVFVISLGFFITPAILGGPKTAMISNLINTEVTVYFDAKAGAAMSIILLIVTLAVISLLRWFGGITQNLKNRF
jgi:putative spermidine/putrescine transport system permease protein